jgi:predicted O-methyltransferase YrrM
MVYWIEKSLRIIKKEGLFSFIEKVSHYVIGPFLVGWAASKLQEKMSEIKKLEDIVDFAFRFKMDGLKIEPSQIKEEILKLLKMLNKIKPRTILEIGTSRGGTLFLFSWIAHENATIISIDLPGGEFGGGYPLWKIPLYRSFARNNQKIYLIRGDSHDEKILQKVKNILRNRKLDLLFIDGDHTYEGVKKDFEMYGKLVGKGGIIAFHDIVYHPFDPECQVDKFWKELKKRYKRKRRIKEIVSSKTQTWAGIGVIFL